MSTLNVNEIQHSSGAGSNIALDNQGNVVCAADVQLHSLNGAGLGRNLFINGAQEVCQRGATGQANVTQVFGTDRWYIHSDPGATFTWDQQPATADMQAAGLAYCLRIRNASAVYQIRQCIELPGAGIAGVFQPNSQWTISCYSSVPLSVAVDFRDSRTTNATSLIPVTAMNDVGGSRYELPITIPNTAPGGNNTCLAVSFSRTDGATGAVQFSGAQFEPGPVSSPYSFRQISTEWSLCQRYFVRVYLGSRVVSEGLGSMITSGSFDGNIYPYVNYLPPMRNVFGASNLVADITNLECATRNNTTSGGSNIRNAGVRLRGEAGLYQISLGCSNAPANGNFYVGMGGNYSVSAEF